MDSLVRNPKIINDKFREYFFPTVLISLASNLAVIVDSVMVGNILGSSEMAAIQLFSPLNQLYYSLTVLFGLGASTLISRALGQRNKRGADSAFTSAFVAITILIFALIALQLLFFNRIVGLLTPLENMEELVGAYYIPFIFGSPFYVYLCCFVYCIRSDGRPKFASNLIILSNVVNLLMDYVLMEIFKLGIMGSSIATVVGNVLAFAIMLSQFWHKGNTLRIDFSIFRRPREFFKTLTAVVSTGLSGTFSVFLITIRLFFLNQLVQDYGGNEGIVAMSIASMALMLISSFITGTCQTMVTLISTFHAQRDNESVVYAFRRAVLFLMLISLVTIALLEFFPSAFAGVFGRQTADELREIDLSLRVTALSYPGMGLTFLILYFLTSTKRNRMSLIVSCFNGILSVPVAYILCFFLGLNGVWVGILLSQYLTLFIAVAMLYYAKKESNGYYKSLLLLEPNDGTERANFSVKSDFSPQELKGLLERGHGLDARQAEKVSEAVSRMKGGTEAPPFYIDVRVTENGSDLNVDLRVNKPEVDSTELEVIGPVENSKILGMTEIKCVIPNS